MTHAEAYQRRIQIAAEVRRGDKPARIARRHSVSLSTVRQAARQHGVMWPRREHKSSIVLRIIARLLAGDSPGVIAHAFYVSPYYVRQIAKDASEAGILMEGDA